MPIPSWQYHEPDHPGADFDAIAEEYDQNMRKVRDIQGEIDEVLDFLDRTCLAPIKNSKIFLRMDLDQKN